ncbi:LysR family transcriptional regulator [Marinivivus vitaminiproducens]|uniref:LysR family transcriptional regulator n=1 Tax=Marinivivus vitaminiproducens TaxID=3035935 RepID=UPI0027AB0550|nr:LysR family transcriptional regulator [Geminicoccaceae bacterium SCSIO 64248]
MPRQDVNRAHEIEVFVRVVERGGFSAAARALGMTPSAVSKLVARLEARLGARLLNRSTRKLELTPEGALFHDRGRRILAEIDSAEREAAFDATPRGRLRVNANVPFGMHHLLPLVPGFLAAHPGVTLDLVLTDAVVDILSERADVAIRVGPLRSSSLIARKLGESRMVVVGAPGYLARAGTPATVADLAGHNQLGFGFARQIKGWPFRSADGTVATLPPEGNALVSDGESMRRLALAGLGLARLARFHVGPDIEAGRLVPVLEDLNPGDTEAVQAVFVGEGGHLPARVRAFLDHLAAHVRLG